MQILVLSDFVGEQSRVHIGGGPCFPHDMGYHDQILYYNCVHLGVCNLLETVPNPYVHVHQLNTVSLIQRDTGGDWMAFPHSFI